MRPLFTIHAGEYLVASHIEKSFKGLNVWVPSKDIGVDLLVTDKLNRSTVSLQVKFSKDHLSAVSSAKEVRLFKAWGWWTINVEKLRKSTADLWVLVVMGIYSRKIQYIVVSPKELYKVFIPLYGNKKIWQIYLKVTKDNKCIATRTLPKIEEKKDFTEWLGNWERIARLG